MFHQCRSFGVGWIFSWAWTEPSRLQLHGGHPHRFLGGEGRAPAGGLGIIGIAPHHMGRRAHRGGIGLQIALQNPDRLEACTQMEADHRIVQLARRHRVQIVDRRRIGRLASQATGHPSAEHDPLQILRLTQVATGIIQALADAQATPVRVDADLHAVEPLSDRIVARRIAAAGDLVPGVRGHRRLLVDAKPGGVTDNLAFVFDYELAVVEGGDLAAKHALGIGRNILVDLDDEVIDGCDIRKAGIADREDGGLGCFGHML